MASSVSSTVPDSTQYYIVVPQQKTKKKLNVLESGLGVMAGAATSSLVKNGIALPYSNLWSKYNNTLYDYLKSNNHISAFENNTQKCFEKSGLKDVGVKVIDASKTSVEEYEKMINPVIEKVIKFKNFPELENMYKKFIKYLYKAVFKMVKAGENSFFAPAFNMIIGNKNSKMLPALPHEMGHAINYHNGGLLKYLQISGALSSKLAPPVILLTALFKNKKEEGEKPKGIFDKVTTFVKDNCGKLTFLAFIPTLIEEASASIKGIDLSKQFLSKENLGVLKRFNLAAWSTYFVFALASSLGVNLASKASDGVKNHFRKEV